MVTQRRPVPWAYLLLAGSVALLVIAVAWIELRTPPSLPPPGPPPPPERSVLHKLNQTAAFYRALVEEDARKFGLAVTADDVARPLVDAVELDHAEPLHPGGVIETPHLVVKARTARGWASAGGAQRFSYEHLVLDVTSKSTVPLAYLVVTDVDPVEACRGMEAIAHDGLVLDPGATASRTECLWRRNMRLAVTRVEVIELPPLARRYVDRLDPAQVGVDPRVAAGHYVATGARPCSGVKWADVAGAGASWRDVIDFYARHSCDEYTFYGAYRFRTGPGPLPALESTAAPSPPPPPLAAPAGGTVTTATP